MNSNRARECRSERGIAHHEPLGVRVLRALSVAVGVARRVEVTPPVRRVGTGGRPGAGRRGCALLEPSDADHRLPRARRAAALSLVVFCAMNFARPLGRLWSTMRSTRREPLAETTIGSDMPFDSFTKKDPGAWIAVWMLSASAIGKV